MSKDGSLYIPVHAGLWDHPKMRRLARRLDIPEVQAVGHLVSLWTWVVRYAPDGDLSDFNDEEIEDAARWCGDSGELIAMLRALEWITDGAVNDWASYSGNGLRLRNDAVERQRARRAGMSVDEYRRRQNATPPPSTGHRDSHTEPSVTVTALSRDVTPERELNVNVNVNGNLTGESSGALASEAEGARAGLAAVAAKHGATLLPPIDRSRQDPSAPPPKPGKVLDDAEIALLRAGRVPQRIGYSGVGFMEDPAKFPEDVDELIEMHRADLLKSFPMLDGKAPRPSLRDAVASKWGAYVKNRSTNGGHANAYSALKTWLGEMAQRHRVSWEREHATVVDGSAAIERTKTTLLRPREGPHPGDDPEAAAEAAKAIEAIKGIGKVKHGKGRP